MIDKLVIIEKPEEGVCYVLTLDGVELTNTVTFNHARMFTDGFLCHLYNKQVGHEHFYVPQDFCHLTGVWAAQKIWEEEMEKYKNMFY